MSLAVLTDSTTAQASAALTLRPTAGSSTNTMSVNSCWAWSVMPTVPVSPSMRSHSWDLAYFSSAGTFELIIRFGSAPGFQPNAGDSQRKNSRRKLGAAASRQREPGGETPSGATSLNTPCLEAISFSAQRSRDSANCIAFCRATGEYVAVEALLLAGFAADGATTTNEVAHHHARARRSRRRRLLLLQERPRPERRLAAHRPPDHRHRRTARHPLRYQRRGRHRACRPGIGPPGDQWPHRGVTHRLRGQGEEGRLALPAG